MMDNFLYYRKRIRRLLFVCIIVLGALSQAVAQNVRSLTGVVKDRSGEPVIGASIIIQETKTGTITDLDGRFSLEVPQSATLNISYIGFLTQTIPTANRASFDIVLAEDFKTIDEVVVVGYGRQRKATLTGAVSAVSSEDIVITKNENVVNMLSGKMPGVRISQLSAQPGEFDSKIDIRGMGEPLIVVDGIPRDKDYFSRMDASEIESVSVLKDASAAIYGLRSANGVLLVTTKRGTSAQTGKFDISYSTNFGWQQFLYVPNSVNAADYMALKNEQIWSDFNSNYRNRQPAIFSEADIRPYLDGTLRSSDYVGAAFDKTSPQQQHNLSVNGSSEKVSYFFNLGYMEHMGAYKSKDLNYNRWNFRSNVDAKITDRLKATIDISGFMDEKNQPRTDIWAVYKQAWRQRPTVPIYVNDNPLYPNYEMIDNENPVAVTNSDITGYRQDIQRSFNGIASLTYDIPGIEGLSARALYSYTFKYLDKTDYKKAYYLYSYDSDNDRYNAHLKNSPTTIQRESFPDYSTLMQLSLNYNRTFADQHNVGALFLYEEGYTNWDSFTARREIAVNSKYLSAGEDLRQYGGMYGAGERANQAFVGKFNYDFSGKYIAEFSFRYDASSRFPKDSRWGFFPAVSVGWRISEEAFIKDKLEMLDNLKIRGSYGKLGDDRDAGDYPQIYTGYDIRSNDLGWYYNGNLIGGVSPTAIPNYNLSWYTSKTLNVGLDFEMWNGLLGGTFDYFKRDREGLLAEANNVIPTIVGASLPRENLKSDQTFGMEVSLSHRNRIGDLTYFVNAQISSTRNKWIDNLETKAGNSYENWRHRNNNRYQDIWWGQGYGGQFTSYEQIYNHNTTAASSGTLPGNYYNEDWNGDGQVNGDDDYPIATYNLPNINYGITLGGAWKGVDLSLNFQGTSGVYTRYDEVLKSPLQFDGTALTQFLDRWRPVDIDADYFDPSTQWIRGAYPVTGQDTGSGKKAIQDASYLRLKTIELGYNIPKEWLTRLGVAGLRVYVSGYNLLTFTSLQHSDPEHPGAAGGASSSSGLDAVQMYKYPVNKSYNIGASIKF